MAEFIRRKWFQESYEDKSNFRAVFGWYIAGMCILFLTIGVLASEYINRLIFVQANNLPSMSHIDYSIFVLFFIAVLLAAFMGFMISRRVFGPIYGLVKHMETVGSDGPATELKLRKGDYFQDVAITYNKMLTRIRENEPKK
jgi:sensor histidine kinase YesM